MTAGKAARTSIVTVAFNSGDVLARMLASIPPGTPVVVVDNASTDSSGAIAEASGAKVVRLARNEGFGRANNAGAHHVHTEFVLFLNPDAELAEGCLAGLEGAADARPTASAFNPRIDHPSGGGEIKWRSMLAPDAPRGPRLPPADDVELPSLTGGALFCRRACFEAVGGFDPAIFLYHEDDDLAVRMRRSCGPLWFVAGARVVHRSGHGSGRSPAVARFKGYHMARSKVHVLAKHGFAAPWLRTFGAALGEAVLPHNLLSARRRAKHLGLLAGAWSARRDRGVFS